MEGYLTLALDSQRYFDMAVNLARSIRYFDKERPIALLYNDRIKIGKHAECLFDHLIEMPAKQDYCGCANKLRVFEYAPFDRNMYIDADCILVKNDIARHWRKCTGYFSMTGVKRRTGKWNDLDLAAVCKRLRVPYVVQMNSGVFAFDRSDEGRDFSTTSIASSPSTGISCPIFIRGAPANMPTSRCSGRRWVFSLWIR